MNLAAVPVARPPARPVAPSELGIALAVSAALHVALVYAVGTFGLDAPAPMPRAERVIEVLLMRDPAVPESAEAGADAAQAVPVPVVEALADAREPAADPARQVESEPAAPERTAAMPPPAAAPSPPEAPSPAVVDLRELARSVARLGGTLAEDGESGRVRRIDASSPETVEDSYYLDAWRRKVERIGALNYPAEARARRIYGTLRLRVSIEPDGALRGVELVESSGHRVLDDAALRIVRLAAPYAPFPPAMREQVDLLEIDRTWRFQRTGGADGGSAPFDEPS